MKIKFFLIFISFLLSITYIDAQSAKDSKQFKQTKWLDGTWYGIGYQPNLDGGENWTISLVYNSVSKMVKIDYPSLSCGGKWKIKEANKNKAVFVEYLTYGLNKCQNESKVVVTRIDDEYITVSFFNPGIVHGVVAFSTLEKKK